MTPEQHEKFKAWAMGYFGLSKIQLECAEHSVQTLAPHVISCCHCLASLSEVVYEGTLKAAWIAALEGDRDGKM